MTNHIAVGDAASAAVGFVAAADAGAEAPFLSYELVCVDHAGVEQWRELVRNTVTIAGKNDLVTKYFTGSGYTAAWYLGLKGSGVISTSDVMTSHSGWSEVAPYSGNRPAIAFGSVSGGSVSGTAISFTITSSSTVAGAFIVSAASGTSGILYSAADFGTARSVSNGDTLSVTPTVSVS